MQCSIKTSEVDFNKIFWWKIFSTDHKIIWKCIYHETEQKTNPSNSIKMHTSNLSTFSDSPLWWKVLVLCPSQNGNPECTRQGLIHGYIQKWICSVFKVDSVKERCYFSVDRLMFGQLSKQKYFYVHQAKNYKFKIKFVEILFVFLLKYVIWTLKKRVTCV